MVLALTCFFSGSQRVAKAPWPQNPRTVQLSAVCAWTLPTTSARCTGWWIQYRVLIWWWWWRWWRWWWWRWRWWCWWWHIDIIYLYCIYLLTMFLNINRYDSFRCCTPLQCSAPIKSYLHPTSDLLTHLETFLPTTTFLDADDNTSFSVGR